jgi:hypothetical protein
MSEQEDVIARLRNQFTALERDLVSAPNLTPLILAGDINRADEFGGRAADAADLPQVLLTLTQDPPNIGPLTCARQGAACGNGT